MIYEHMGFRVERRSALDEQGNPYPVLYMRREKAPKSYPQSYAQVWDSLVENVQKAVDNSVGELGKTVDKSAKIRQFSTVRSTAITTQNAFFHKIHVNYYYYYLSF